MTSQVSVPRVLVQVLLLSLSAAAWYSLMISGFTNGTFKHIRGVIAQGSEAKMPGTDFPLVRSYTGFAAIDHQLSILVIFFARAVDGSTAGFASWGMSQFGAAWYVMFLEGLRVGNKGRIISWTGLFGTVIQIITFAVTAPIWLALHLLTSPIAQSIAPPSSIFISEKDLNVVPLVFGLSYIFPSLLMGFPSPEQVSPNMHQLFIVVWQAFPIYTSVLQFIMPPAFEYRLDDALAMRKSKFIDEDSEAVAYLKSSKNVYLFALTYCAVTHLIALGSLFFDTTFADIFIPFSFLYPGEQVPDLATGVKNFLQIDVYIGVTAMLLWSTYLYLSAPSAPGTIGFLAVKAVFWAAIAGPMGIVLILLGARDDAVLYAQVQKEMKVVLTKKKN